jgi:hypothetical protein
MNFAFLMLAKAQQPHPTFHFPGQNELLGWANEMGIGTAILITLLGVIYLLYGWSMFKGLIMLNAVIVGGYIGAVIGLRVGGYALVGVLLGAIAAGAATWPLMKWAVAVMGGICGAFVGAAVWLTANLDPTFAWAGAMTGLVGFGLFAFILFRGSIIMYTSIQGSAMVIVGLLGLIFKYPEMSVKIGNSLGTQPLVMPILILVPAVLGLIFQQTHSGGGDGGGGEKKK